LDKGKPLLKRLTIIRVISKKEEKRGRPKEPCARREENQLPKTTGIECGKGAFSKKERASEF